MASSIVTSSSIHQCKLVVHIAENGHTFELECNGNTLVEAVMRHMEPVLGINFNDQLVLSSDLRLEPQKALSAYKLPSDNEEVVIFNKARLQPTSPPPPPEQIDIVEVPDPQPPTSSSQDPHLLDEDLDPALKALPSYERQFRYHYQRGHAIYSRTLLKYETCERLWREQNVQQRAVGVASSNLEQYYKNLNQNYTEFTKRYTIQHRVHSDLLANFLKELDKLRSLKLHPALQTTTRKCLLDLVKEESLCKVAENCSISHRQFENKVLQFKQIFADVTRKVEELFASRASSPIRNLDPIMEEHLQYIHEQKSIMQSLSKDVSTVKKLVDDCVSCKLSSLRPHDAVSALGPMYDVHDKNHLPQMQACDVQISKLLDLIKDKKNEMSIFMHNYMRKIAYVVGTNPDESSFSDSEFKKTEISGLKIGCLRPKFLPLSCFFRKLTLVDTAPRYVTYFVKDAKCQFPVFKEAVVRQDELFADLKLVRGIGPAYRACLAEVVRRKASMKLYMGMAGQLAEKLATKREVEVSRREEFLKSHSSYMPQDLLSSMGLYDTPSQCDVNLSPFDTNLLNIDISDLERYAPEHLAGLSSRGASLKGSASNSSYSAEAEDPGVENIDKNYSNELLEASELVEIAGTSKIEVENAKLKAELASAIAVICSLRPEVEYETLDDSKLDSLLKDTAEKTAEALHLKDEYGKHLQSMLKAKHMQCVSYEKRIKELEQRLSDQYMDGQKLSNSKDVSESTHLAVMDGEAKREISAQREGHTEAMDEISCIVNSFDAKLGPLTRPAGKYREGVDETMTDSSGMLNSQMDSSMMEPQREDIQVCNSDAKDKKMTGQLGMSMTNSSTAESMPEPLNILPCEAVAESSKVSHGLLLELQNAFAEKSNQLSDTETKLEAATNEVGMLRREFEMSRKLLDESQLNCAHLENCLHGAREEAQTHLCAADRRASEYSALRTSAVKMHGLFERLKSCVLASGGVTAFADSLRVLAQSLANSINETDDDGTAEFRKCIRVLADKVNFLSRHREELLNKCPKLEAANEQLRKELEEKKELVKTLYTKHQHEKQANKEKISFRRFEVHELAAFILNSTGHYEAINRNCSNYYLSTESVALFTEHLPSRPSFIVGQIVHIERQTVKPLPPNSPRPEHNMADPIDHLTTETGPDRITLNSGWNLNNPYALAVGCEYFVVTVAMLPDTVIHSSLAS